MGGQLFDGDGLVGYRQAVVKMALQQFEPSNDVAPRFGRDVPASRFVAGPILYIKRTDSENRRNAGR